MSKLSIITINKNNASGLRKTIQSVLAQKNKNFEYIIIDGGSTDDSVEVIKSVTTLPQGKYTSLSCLEKNEDIHSCITYWISEPDRGIYNAMNKGIRISSGEYCQFLNSGDILASPKVTDEMLFGDLKSSFIVGNMLKESSGMRIYRDCGIAGSRCGLFNFYKGTINHSAAYIKRKLFEKYGYYDEELQIVSDWKFFLIAVGLHKESVEYKNIDVTIFDMSGISNTDKIKEMSERRAVLKKLLPPGVLADYDLRWMEITQIERIGRYKITAKIVWLMDRILFKFEKNFNFEIKKGKN